MKTVGVFLSAISVTVAFLLTVASTGSAAGHEQGKGVGTTFLREERPLAASQGPLLVPSAFQVHAGNGYTLTVLAAPPRGGDSGSLLILAAARGKGAFYAAPATVTATSIQSNLGELGEMSVTFQPAEQPKSIPCGKGDLRVESGSYEGKIDFHGEEGYTSVEATSAPASFAVFAAVCGSRPGNVTSGPQGVRLDVRSPRLGPRLSVEKNHPGGRALITAAISEKSDGISIERFTSLQMPGADFKYDSRLRTATVRPPAPFSGSARFDLGKKAGRRWSGNLTVDLPGKSDVPLTGPTLRAKLAPSE
jgi:hypothetical protein